MTDVLSMLPATGTEIPLTALWVGGALAAAGLILLLVKLARHRGRDTADTATDE